MRALILLAAIALIQAGCSLSTEPGLESGNPLRLGAGDVIVFRAERSEYRHGETAKIILRNETDQAVGYNLCISARELRSGGEWKRYEPLRICTMALYSLVPGAETAWEEPITTEWQPGEYRMVTTVELMGNRTRGEVFTPSFTVRP